GLGRAARPEVTGLAKLRHPRIVARSTGLRTDVTGFHERGVVRLPIDVLRVGGRLLGMPPQPDGTDPHTGEQEQTQDRPAPTARPARRGNAREDRHEIRPARRSRGAFGPPCERAMRERKVTWTRDRV